MSDKTNVMHRPSKLILENHTDLPMVDFLKLAQEVVFMGRISNDDKQYCYLVSFTIDGQEYHIVSDLNKKSDKLTFYKKPLNVKVHTPLPATASSVPRKTNDNEL